MAVYYVWSAAAGSANGSSWANAFTTLATAFTTEVAGDTLYVAHDHVEATASSLILDSSGTAANPTKVICVNRAGSVPPVSSDRRATAQVTTTGNINISLGLYTYYDGIIFIAGNSTGTANITLQNTSASWTRLDNCSLRLGGTGAASRIVHGSTGAYAELNNTTMSFSVVGQAVSLGALLRWRNTASALIGAAVPTTLFIPLASSGGAVECIGVDLSAAGSGKTIFGATGTSVAQRHALIDCKLNAAVTRSTVPGGAGTNDVDIIRSGATGLNYTFYRHRASGLLEQETTIVRTGGASDGTTPIAWKVITTANCNYSMPFECPPIAIWNDTTGSSVTATVECIGAAIATDQEVWIECEFLGDASSPMGSFASDSKVDLLATAANQTSSSETWGGSTAAFKLAVTFTPQQRGWIYARVKVGKVSSTFYVDPLITLT